MQWLASAPSNIALIKYMGKADSKLNLAANASLSYTLPHLLTHVQLECISGKDDQFSPLTNSIYPLNLSHASKTRFLHHLQRLKAYYNYSGAFLVRSANDFPHGTGLASSASSFAALTRCAVQALSELTGAVLPTIEQQSAWSREGSGSSCRSFFAPWALWDEHQVTTMHFPKYEKLYHVVIIVDSKEKLVSSSEAHLRIQSSIHYAERTMRAQDNLNALCKALTENLWHDAYTICWREFQDMHKLFATSTPAFTYISALTQSILNILKSEWDHFGDGPLVTLDAGPNIHLLYRLDQIDLALNFQRKYQYDFFAPPGIE